jgi:hypothetical protein
MPWRRLRGEEYSSYSFKTSALDGGKWSASRPGRAFNPEERTPPSDTHCIGGWAPVQVWTQRKKSFAPAGGRTPVVQPVYFRIKKNIYILFLISIIEGNGQATEVL